MVEPAAGNGNAGRADNHNHVTAFSELAYAHLDSAGRRCIHEMEEEVVVGQSAKIQGFGCLRLKVEERESGDGYGK